MRLLISNDDGVFAPGIKALAERLQRDHEIVVVAPASEQSGVGHGLTFLTPLMVKKSSIEGIDAPVFAVQGRPVDCVKLGLAELCGFKPDLVVSGINQGGNLGVDVFPSGTVNAAMAGAMSGIGAVAVSLCDFFSKDFSAAAEYAARLIDFVKDNPIPKGRVLNLNVPALPLDEIKGMKLSGMDEAGYDYAYTSGTTPFGLDYYWMSTMPGKYESRPKNTDCSAVVNGYASVTALKVNLSDTAYMRKLKQTGAFVE